ncbi:hypothetical protein BJ875DRAFT_13659 [Amylocarpus encephaloides]|uniref:Mid2 domain-containing protein n=1 Tax=Amylocarpus encephaloides TaxID=45428 RepID=A0A9P8C9R6_9HELO|nr:hypothetical protein BJ875DRAFT_13659 [Amylocarpus encephaloides]
MRGIQLASSACLFNLLVLARAEQARHVGPDRGPVPEAEQSKGLTTVTETTFVNTFITPRSTAALSSSSSSPITQTTTLSIIPNTLTSQPVSVATATTVAISSLGGEFSTSQSIAFISQPATTEAPANEIKEDDRRRTLIIILSTVLGSLALLLVGLSICLTRRYRKHKSPFSHRGASPINDEEIASWRTPSSEQKVPIPPTYPPRVQDISTIGLAHYPGWMWNSQLPRASHSHSHSHSQSHSVSSPSVIIPPSPSSMARAPNSRAGLTDETKPGADAYIPPMKRQSSRLSKAPPGHSRTKSRRSSLSNRSIWSYNGPSSSNVNVDGRVRDRQPTWYDPENDNVARQLPDFDHNSSPGTSIWDTNSVGGLSPRPASRPRLFPSASDKEIGGVSP